MITYKATIRETDIIFLSTRMADIKKWVKTELEKGAECIEIYAYHRAVDYNTFEDYGCYWLGSIYNDEDSSFKKLWDNFIQK